MPKKIPYVQVKQKMIKLKIEKKKNTTFNVHSMQRHIKNPAKPLSSQLLLYTIYINE